MKDLSDSIETLSEKTDRLIKAYRGAKTKVESLISENNKFKSKIEGLNEELERMKEENKVLKMAAAIKGDGESVTETKRRISQMVREIDRCIAQLND
ncbi:MAG: hypothetical protein R2813_10130 [Flavobacteriales bacterium]